MTGFSLFRPFLDFLFPPRCPLCHAYVAAQGDWCPACLKQAGDPHKIVLPAAMSGLIRSAWALGIYRGGLRQLVHQLKYKKRHGVRPYIDTFLKHTLQDQRVRLPDDLDAAVAVPLHPAREKERGFNQVECIFSGAMAVRKLPLERLLVRRLLTKPLYALSRQERKLSLQHAFALSPAAAVKGRHILLLDDIMTTGTTLTMCAKVLRQGGAASVDALVLASDHA